MHTTALRKRQTEEEEEKNTECGCAKQQQEKDAYVQRRKPQSVFAFR